MKEQFILNWVGNKYEELKKDLKRSIIDRNSFDKYDTIIEPFGGSFGFIRYLYQVLDIKDKKFIVYDSDKDLIDFYNHLKKINISNFMDRYNNILSDIENLNGSFVLDKTGRKVVFKKVAFNYIDKTIKDKYMKYVLKTNISTSSFCRFNYKRNMIFIDLIKKITFIHKPFLEINFNKYNRSKTYIFLDPPYLDNDNSFYQDKEVESLLDKIYNVMRKFSSVFIHVKNDTIDKMFKVFLVDSYAKLYRLKKKRVIHNVFMSN